MFEVWEEVAMEGSHKQFATYSMCHNASYQGEVPYHQEDRIVQVTANAVLFRTC